MPLDDLHPPGSGSRPELPILTPLPTQWPSAGEELTLLPGQVPAHTLSDLSHWCGGSSHLQAPIMPNIHELEQVQGPPIKQEGHSAFCLEGR